MENIINIKELKIDNILNDMFRDLSILGFIKNDCRLIYYNYAKIYAKLISDYSRKYGLSELEAEDLFKLKQVRKTLACKYIDLDLFLTEFGFEYSNSETKYTFFNKYIVPTNKVTYLTTSANLILTTNANQLIYI